MEFSRLGVKLALAFVVWVTLANAEFCENTPNSRNCWGEYSSSTDYSHITPDTGVTREARMNADLLGKFLNLH